jgi:hypothetical protein
MGRPARVKSIDALQTMSAAFECFRADASTALDDLDIEIRRALQWIGQDCRQYWNQEVRRSRDAVNEAQIQLHNALTFRRIDKEQRASCVEEKKVVERAKRRLQIAESKVEAIPHWVVTIERVIDEYRASRSQFANWLESDFPKAVAVLGRMIAALETYVRLGTPASEQAPIVWPDKDSKEDNDEAKTAGSKEDGPDSHTQTTEP